MLYRYRVSIDPRYEAAKPAGLSVDMRRRAYQEHADKYSDAVAPILSLSSGLDMLAVVVTNAKSDHVHKSLGENYSPYREDR
ncbi:MAG: hypothetical protein OES12_10055 [Anaerolineae bacterium]|nr:hypothetical protein [Anaerolineae bacterium]